MFVEIAKEAYPDELRLFTLVLKNNVIQFYKKRGFRFYRHGISPDEGVPDVLMIWQQEFHAQVG